MYMNFSERIPFLPDSEEEKLIPEKFRKETEQDMRDKLSDLDKNLGVTVYFDGSLNIEAAYSGELIYKHTYADPGEFDQENVFSEIKKQYLETVRERLENDVRSRLQEIDHELNVVARWENGGKLAKHPDNYSYINFEVSLGGLPLGYGYICENPGKFNIEKFVREAAEKYKTIKS